MNCKKKDRQLKRTPGIARVHSAAGKLCTCLHSPRPTKSGRRESIRRRIATDTEAIGIANEHRICSVGIEVFAKLLPARNSKLSFFGRYRWFIVSFSKRSTVFLRHFIFISSNRTLPPAVSQCRFIKKS